MTLFSTMVFSSSLIMVRVSHHHSRSKAIGLKVEIHHLMAFMTVSLSPVISTTTLWNLVTVFLCQKVVLEFDKRISHSVLV